MLKLGPDQLTREQIEERIAAVSRDIDICNRKIAEANELIKERAKLRTKLQSLVNCISIVSDTESEFRPLFVFKGKTKDLLEALQSEIQKAK